MNLILSLDADFHPDTAEHVTALVYNAQDELLGTVVIDFCAGMTLNQHEITTVLPDMPHGMQARIILAVSDMLDSHFGEEDAYSSMVLEV